MRFLFQHSQAQAGLSRLVGQSGCRCQHKHHGTGILANGLAGSGSQVRGMSRLYEDHERARSLAKKTEGLGSAEKEERFQYDRNKKKRPVQQEGLRHNQPPFTHSRPSPRTPFVSSHSVKQNISSNGVDGTSRSDLSFEALGLDGKVVKGLSKAFPNVIEPTLVQEKLIPELLGGKDILLKDCTGSGKSFGVVLGLLSKPRASYVDETSGKKKRTITSLMIVPHRDLAYQFADWIKRIVEAIPNQERPSLDSVVQVLVRGGDKSCSDIVDQLRKEPPHILICTPQAFMEAYKMDKDALGIKRLQAVAVDEVDYLVETAARKDPNKSFRQAYEKAKKAIEKHPGQTRQILDMIYARRKVLSEAVRRVEEDEDGDDDVYRRRVEWRCGKEKEEGIPQLIMSSATMRVHLRDYLFEESGWLNSYNLVKVFGKGKMGTAQGIMHSVLVVGEDGVIKNIEEAAPGPIEVERNDSDILEVEEDISVEEVSEYENTKSPFDGHVMEAIATCFALDVSRMGLVIVGSSAPIGRAVYELRQLGVDAHGLSYSKGETFNKGNKGKLLVGSVATSRGIDFEGLSHVFIIGLPYCGVAEKVSSSGVDGYVHLAGRVARFGNSTGKVISIVTESQKSKVVRILNTINATPVRFEQFD